MSPRIRTTALLGLFALAMTSVAWANSAPPLARFYAANVIVPQAGVFRPAEGPASGVKIAEVRAGAVIVEQTAATTLELVVENPTNRRQEAALIVPIPDGAVVRAFAFEGPSAEPTAELLPKDRAAGVYHTLVARVRDPALLEFTGAGMLRSSVFPVEPHGKQKIRVTYEHLLAADGPRIDYLLPRSESLDYNVPWKIAVRVKAKAPIQTVYSPTHAIETARAAENIVSAKVAGDGKIEPGPFRLSYLLRRDEVTASFLSYPDAKTGGGYFLLLAGLPTEGGKAAAPGLKREVTLVIDRSGSMRGAKLEQVKAAALTVLSRLDDGEAFNLIAYNEAVESFSSRPVVKKASTVAAARAWIGRLTASGGTNIYDALNEALRPGVGAGMLPLALFLTDGLPTTGRTSEAAIRQLAGPGNPAHRRIFTFGVGADVNTPLLNALATESRATATFVLNQSEVDQKITGVFERLSGPALAEPRLTVVDAPGRPIAGAVADLLPARLPDLFKGDQLVALGRYTANQKLTFELTGDFYGRQRTFRFAFDVDRASTNNSFVPRLWASRRIGALTDAIRQAGVDLPPPVGGMLVSTAATDPRTKELVEEIVRLSTEFGVMTEYTAFLALEGSNLSSPDAVMQQARRNFDRRATQVRSGVGSVNQEMNINAMASQATLNHANYFNDENLNRVSVNTVRQVADRAFYQRGNRWVDSSYVANAAKTAAREVRFGTNEYFALADQLAGEGRQGALALNGDILLNVDGRAVLVRGPAGR